MDALQDHAAHVDLQSSRVIGSLAGGATSPEAEAFRKAYAARDGMEGTLSHGVRTAGL